LKTAGGHYRIPEEEIERFPHRAVEDRDISEWRSNNLRRISVRNQLVGRVAYIRVGGLLAQVTISGGGLRITSIITADAIREMRLKNGQTVAALIKSTDVMIVRL
jgi:molybdopterin-binding protein